MQAELFYDLQLILITDMLRYQFSNMNYFYFFKSLGWSITGMDSNVNVVLKNPFRHSLLSYNQLSMCWI